jgi:hypothetical protein
MGTLTVNASPWGKVYLDGQFLQNTPLLRHPVKAGPHHVRVEHKTFGSREATRTVEPGKLTTVIVDFRAGTQ